MHLYASGDAYNQLQPRHRSRKERQPGLRERHATQRERHSPDTPRTYASLQSQTTPRSTYCHTSGVEYNPPIREEIKETKIQTSLYKELSTIEDIRASMRATASKTPATVMSHVPDWLLNLDINLDVTCSDIIPPFEQTQSDNTDTFKEAATMSLIYDSEYEYDSEPDSIDEIETHQKVLNDSRDDSAQYQLHSGKQEHASLGLMNTVTLVHKDNNTTSRSVSPTVTFRRGTEHLGSARSRHTPTDNYYWEDNMDYGPRRYQGDKTVMSMQKGGIRSTPMQPKSKKYINQMITFRHMKIHDKKLQKAKPAVDTKMPPTFKMALDRKRLVETRLESSRDSSDFRSSRTSLGQSISQKSNR